MVKTFTKKEIAIRLIESYIGDIKEFRDSTSVDRYDGAVHMAMMAGLITATERKKFDKEVNNIMYAD